MKRIHRIQLAFPLLAIVLCAFLIANSEHPKTGAKRTKSQVTLESKYSNDLLRASHQVRGIRASMNRLSPKQFQVVQELYESALQLREDAIVRFQQLQTCDQDDWKVHQNILENDLQELSNIIEQVADEMGY